jgi:hypothetical protein
LAGEAVSEVPATRTPLTRDATAALFVPAYVAIFGAEPDQNRAEMLLALAWLENANGQSFIQFDWGNLSTSPSSGVDYWRPPWFDAAAIAALPEGTAAEQSRKSRMLDLHSRMLAHQAPEAFRAFTSHDAGIAAWLRVLAQPNMAPVLAAASSGDPVAFAHAIFSSRYCPDPECQNAGPSYGALRDQIHAAAYFDGLKKKPRARAAARELQPSYWSWRARRERSLRSGSYGGVGRP